MKTKTLMMLVGGFAALAAIAFLTDGRKGSRMREDAGVRAGDKVLKEFDPNAATRLVIAQGSANATLEKKGDEWVAASLFGYPAEFDRIRTALIKLSDLKAGDVVQRGTAVLDDFNLSTNAVTVEVKGEGDQTLAKLLLGKNRKGADDGSGFGGGDEGRYVRVENGPVILVEENFSDLSTDGGAWVNKQILNLATPDVTEAGISSTNGAFVVKVQGEGQYTVDGLKENEEIDTARAGRLHRGLQYITFEELADPAKPDAEHGLDKADVYMCNLKNGLSYTVLLGKKTDKGRIARFNAEYKEPAAPTEADADKLVPAAAATNAVASAATNAVTNVVAAASTNAPPRAELVKKKLEELKAEHQRKVDEAKAKLAEVEKLKRWVFVINTYAAESLAPLRSDVVKPKAAPAAATPPDGAPAPTLVPPATGGPISVTTEPIAVPPLPPPPANPANPPSPPAAPELPPAPAPAPAPAPPAEPAKPAEPAPAAAAAEPTKPAEPAAAPAAPTPAPAPTPEAAPK